MLKNFKLFFDILNINTGKLIFSGRIKKINDVEGVTNEL